MAYLVSLKNKLLRNVNLNLVMIVFFLNFRYKVKLVPGTTKRGKGAYADSGDMVNLACELNTQFMTYLLTIVPFCMLF